MERAPAREAVEVFEGLFLQDKGGNGVLRRAEARARLQVAVGQLARVGGAAAVV